MARKPRSTRPAEQRTVTSPDTPRRSPDWPVVILAGLGLLITGYLIWVAWSGESAAFCAEGSACEIIQGSRWSTLLGLPIALWGFGLYALITGVAWSMPPRLKRWRRLSFLALAGVAISVYLTAVGIIYLDAVCGWCLASLAIITAIFVVVLVRRPGSAPGMSWPAWSLNALIIAVMISGILHAWQTDLLRPEDPRLKALAMHLEETGAVFYGVYWCPNCSEQKRLFGGSADRLPYVECTPHGRAGGLAFECASQDIRSYPTWIIGNRQLTRVLEPEELAGYSGFDWEGFEVE